jgi:hypothetical protein
MDLSFHAVENGRDLIGFPPARTPVLVFAARRKRSSRVKSDRSPSDNAAAPHRNAFVRFRCTVLEDYSYRDLRQVDWELRFARYPLSPTVTPAAGKLLWYRT